jgi:DNA-binding transcriptional MerR regulator
MPSEPKREVSEIRRLISRRNWLSADADYQATLADTEEKSERLSAIHNAEKEKIERELATLIPETFWEAMELLEFATKMVEEGGNDNLEIDMLENVRKGFPEIKYNEMMTERAKAREEAIAETRHPVELAFKVGDSIEAKRKERAAS